MSKKRLPNLRIDGYKTKDLRSKRFKIAILSTLAVVILVGGYQYARKQKVLREYNREADEIFTQVEEKIATAKEKLSTDRENAQTYLFSANELLNGVPEGMDEDHFTKLAELKNELILVEDTLYRRFVVDPQSFIGFFEEDTNLTDIKYVVDGSRNELLIVTDKGSKTVWSVSIYDKSKQAIADNDGIVSSPEFVDIGNNKDIFVFDSDVGVIKAPVSDSGWGAFTKLTGVGVNNLKIGNVSEFAVLTGTDNLYYLDTDNSRIVKSVNYGTGYSSAVTNVLNDDKFTTAGDFFADFSIYVLTSNGEGILRYSAGTYDPLTISGVNGSLGELTCGDTSGSMDSGLYVFDSTNLRILRFEKPKDGYNDKLHPNELVLTNQYIYRGGNSDMWKDVKDIVVDSKEEYLYMLDGNNVLRFPL